MIILFISLLYRYFYEIVVLVATKGLSRMDDVGLSVDSILPLVQKRIDELQQAIDFLQKQIERAPEGALCGSRSHSSWQWQILLGNVRTYLSGDKVKLVKALAQKKYNLLVLKDFVRQRDALDKLMESYVPQNGEKTYASMPAELQSEIVPLTLPDSEFVEAWRSQRYKRKFVENSDFLTANGERVRSKSEIIIADALNSFGVPYHYEFPHELNAVNSSRRIKVFSDFTCLNVRTRKEFVWEHFGMMDDAEYLRNAMEKIDMYACSGFYPGENLILTMESRDKPLNSKMVNRLVGKYLI